MSAVHKEQMQAALKAARDIAAKAEDEGRDFTDEERSAVESHMADYKSAKQAFERAEGDANLRKQLADLGAELGMERTPENGKTRPDTYGSQRAKSIGQTFIDSAEYKSFLAQFPNGEIPAKARVQSLPVGFKALVTGTADDSAGAFVQPDVTGILEALGRRPLTIRDLISTRQTGSDTVEFVQQLSRVNAAAPVPEASSTAPIGDGTAGTATATAGGVKPEGGFTFQKVTSTVKTIAEWVPATKRALSDASQLRGLIDQELRDDLREEEEDQVLNGSGAGENLTGLLNTSGTQSQTFAAGGNDIFLAARRGRRMVRTVGRSIPTAYLLNPEDWEKYDTARDNSGGAGTGQFLGGGPFASQQPTLWGLPVVESEAVPVGTGVVGDFRKAVLWDREQASVSISDSHADFFIRNLVAVLAEERVAFGVTRPSAFVEFALA